MTAEFIARSPWQLAWQRFKRDRLALVGTVIFLLILLAVLIGPWVYRVPIDQIDFSQTAALPS